MLNRKIITLLMLACVMTAGCGAKKTPDAMETASVAEEEKQEDTELLDAGQKQEEPQNEEEHAEKVPENAENDEGTGDGRVFTLYSLAGDEAAEITVPEFLPETYYTEVTLTANDEMTYTAAYGAYNGWDADAFFSEAISADSETETVAVNGKEVTVKKISVVYDDIKITQYAAAIEFTGGVIGVGLSATGVPDADAEFLEILSGVVPR